MLITLMVKKANDGDHGAIMLKKVDMDGSKLMGEIHYEDAKEKEWLLMVLMERHPNVALVEGENNFEGIVHKAGEPCCFFGAMLDALAEEKNNKSPQ
jgi:hypothetical protein